MKGLAQYILILLITGFIVIFSFFLLSQLLSKEEEVSTISRIFASIVNKSEYSKAYFIKMVENEYVSLKGSFDKEGIAGRLPKEYRLEVGDVTSLFKVQDVELMNDGLRLEIVQTSYYSNSNFQVEAKKVFTVYLR